MVDGPESFPALRHRLVAACVIAVALLPVAGVVQADETPLWDLEVVDAGLPGTMQPGQRIEVAVTVANRGTESWTAGEDVSIAAHWLDAGGEVLDWEGERTALPKTVEGGESVTVNAALTAPEIEGEAAVLWDVVWEHRLWVSRQDPTPAEPVEVRIVRYDPGGGASEDAGKSLWMAFGLTVVLAVLALGARRDWWRRELVASRTDLVWMILIPCLVERAVTEVSFAGTLVTALLWTAIAAVVGLVRARWRPWVGWAVGTIGIAVFAVDRLYLRFFFDLPSIESLAAAGQTGQIGASIGSLLRPSDLVMTGIVFGGGIIAASVASMGMRDVPMKVRGIVAVIMAATCTVVMAWAAGLPIQRQVFRRIFVAKEIGVTAVHAFDTGRWIGRTINRRTVSRTELEPLIEWFHIRRGDRSGTGPTFGRAQGMNLVMVQAESVQNFAVGLDIEGQPVMPTLTRWAEEGVYFSQITDQTGHGRSSDAELISQTSLLPLAGSAAAFACASNHFTALAGVLGDRGYATVSAVPFDGDFWNRRLTHRAYGYRKSWFTDAFESGRRVGWGLNDRDFMAQAAEKMAGLPEPWCAWLLTLSLHHPFEGFPDDLQVLDVGRWEGRPVGEYLHTMHYLDAALADLEAGLEASGQIDHTVVVVWGDHDAGFDWTQEVAGLMGVSFDSAGWYRSQRVPLIIRFPRGLGLRGRVTTPGGHVDIAPTVASLFGVDAGGLPWMGRNLLGTPGDRPVVGEYGCWTTASRLFLQGDAGTLEDGRCLVRPALDRAGPETCADGFREAAQRVNVAQRILRRDLQQAVGDGLRQDDR